MSNEELIQEQLNKYSESFDLYLDGGAITPPDSQDPLQEYLYESVFEPFNFLHCKDDPLWREVFKNDILAFFTSLLQAFLIMDKKHQNELVFMQKFFDADIETKRTLWDQTVCAIEKKYSSDELNPYGFLNQLQGKTEDQYEPVFEAMRQHWKQVSDDRLLQEKRELINSNKQQFQSSFKGIGSNDYKTLFASKEVFFKYPVLKEIVEIIGRDKPQSKEEKDTTVTHYLPSILSHANVTKEVDGISIGNNIQQVLPSEMVYLSGKETEDVFYHRFATKQLQQMAPKPPMSQKKTEHTKAEKPRMIKGPIIVSVDTSGSMEGKPMKVAKSLLLQLLQMARRQKRACYLITYSVHAQAIDLAHPANWRLVRKFLQEGFTGGTDGNEMLLESVSMLQTKTYSMADVLIISDFRWSQPYGSTLKKMREEQKKGTKFYGLGIQVDSQVYQHKWLDKMWNIDTI